VLSDHGQPGGKPGHHGTMTDDDLVIGADPEQADLRTPTSITTLLIGRAKSSSPNGVLRTTFILVAHRYVISGSADMFSLGRTKQPRAGRRS
jgi:hypothetical protein